MRPNSLGCANELSGATSIPTCDSYNIFMSWEALRQCSLEVGCALQGALLVADLHGVSLRSLLATQSVVKTMLAQPTFPEGENPLPEGARKFLVCGGPWWVSKVWIIVRRILPKRTIEKISIYSESQQGDFLRELFERVEPEQVPSWVGGEAKAELSKIAQFGWERP